MRNEVLGLGPRKDASASASADSADPAPIPFPTAKQTAGASFGAGFGWVVGTQLAGCLGPFLLLLFLFVLCSTCSALSHVH